MTKQLTLSLLFFSVSILFGLPVPWKPGDTLAFRFADGSYLARLGNDLVQVLDPTGNGSLFNWNCHFKIDQVGSGTTFTTQNLGITEDMFCLLDYAGKDRVAIEQDANNNRVLSFKPTTNSKGWISVIAYNPASRVALLDGGQNARIQRVKSMETRTTGKMYGMYIPHGINNLICRQVTFKYVTAKPADYELEVIPVDDKYKIFYNSSVLTPENTQANISAKIKVFSDAFDLPQKSVEDWFYLTRLFAALVDDARRKSFWDSAQFNGIKVHEYVTSMFKKAISELALLRSLLLTAAQKAYLTLCERMCWYYLITLREKVVGYSSVVLPASGAAVQYYLKVNGQYLSLVGGVLSPKWTLSSVVPPVSSGVMTYYSVNPESTDSFSITGKTDVVYPLRYASLDQSKKGGLVSNADILRFGVDESVKDIFLYESFALFENAPAFYQVKGCKPLGGALVNARLCVASNPNAQPLFKMIGEFDVVPVGYEPAFFTFEPVPTTKLAFLSVPPLESFVRTAKIDFILDEMVKVGHSHNPSSFDSLKFARSGAVLGKLFSELTDTQQAKFLSAVML